MTHYLNDSATAEYLKEMADMEHDDPEQAPTYRGERLVNLGGVVLATVETAEALMGEPA